MGYPDQTVVFQTPERFCYDNTPCETAGLRAEPSPSQKGDPRTAGPVD